MDGEKTTIMDGERTTIMDGEKTTIMDGERTTIMDVDKTTVMDGDKTTIMKDGGMDDDDQYDGASDRTMAYGNGSMETTMRPDSDMSDASSVNSSLNVFNLRGDEYEQVSVLSENTGEAQVFLVKKDGKEYVLTGVRTHDRLVIRVDDSLPIEFRFSATYPLDRPLKMSVGPTLGGTGDILWAEVGMGWPRDMPRPATRREVFAEGEVTP
jgi:hypothetical protein